MTQCTVGLGAGAGQPAADPYRPQRPAGRNAPAFRSPASRAYAKPTHLSLGPVVCRLAGYQLPIVSCYRTGVLEDSPTLYGRESELGRLQAAATRLGEGRGATLALTGEPGIGKSSLARAFADAARGQGVPVAWGRAWESGSQPPYWPFRMLFETLQVDRQGPARGLWGHGAEGGAASDPRQARFELLEGVAGVLRDVSGRGPVACILEDLHAADLPSLELLEFLMLQLEGTPIAWLLTWRSGKADQVTTLAHLSRIRRNCEPLTLSRLNAQAGDALIAERLAEMSESARSTVYRATGGNPLYLVETVAALQGTPGAESPTAEQLPIAEGIAALVLERTARLDDLALQALQVGCALGRTIHWELWSHALDTDRDTLVSSAQVLVEAGLLRPQGGDGYLVSHELVRAAVLSAAPPTLVAEAHARAAIHLDRRVREGDVTAVGERAHHGMRSRGNVPTSTALDWVLEASRAARGQCALDEALAVLELAREQLNLSGAEEVRRLLDVACTLLLLDRTDEARSVLEDVMRRAQALDDPSLQALAVLTAGERYVLGDVMDDLVERIDTTLEQLGSNHRTLRARLLARKAAALTPARDVAGTLRIAEDAESLIGDDDPIHARIQVAIGTGAAMADFAPAPQRVAVSQRLRLLARQAGDRVLELRGLSRLITDELECGRTSRADMLLVERAELVATLPQLRFTWMQPLFRSMRAMGEGRFADCEDAIAEVVAMCERLNDPNVRRCLAVHRAHLYLVADDRAGLDRIRPEVAEALRTMPGELWIVMGALIALRKGDDVSAREQIAVLNRQLAHCATTTLGMLAEVVAEVGSDDLRRAVRSRLEPHAGSHANWGLFALTSGPPVSACIALLDQALGEPESAERHFADATKQTTEAGLNAQRAWVKYWWSRAASSTETGARLLGQAQEEAEQLGMAGLVARCGAAPQAEAPDGGVGLTLEPQGGGWVLHRREQADLLFPDLRGMKMLARLLAAPGQEIHALDLVAEADGVADLGDAGEQLDSQALAAYRQRVEQLRAEVAESEAAEEADRGLRAQEELETLLRELSRGVGLGGRARRAGADSERARVSAQRRIRAAIKKITAQDQEVGDHLAGAVRTGLRCVYRR